jgi:hypothetical protein
MIADLSDLPDLPARNERMDLKRVADVRNEKLIGCSKNRGFSKGKSLNV